MQKDDMAGEIKNLLGELFSLIGINPGIEVSEEKGEDGEASYKVEIDPGESAGLLIGAHGATLSAIQSFLTIAIKQKTGEWIRVSMDVAGWGKKQNERLIELARSASDRAKQTGEPQKLYNLTSSQRRIIHMALAEDKEIETESQGEGQDRYLIVKAK